MISFRNAGAADFDLIFEIKKHSIKPYVEKIWGWDEGVQLNHHTRDFAPDHIRVILNDDREIGILDVVETADSICINSILIHETAQGNGVGTQIVSGIIQQANQRNKAVQLQVFKINHRAKKLYEKLGFVICGQTDIHYQMTKNPVII